MGCNIFKVQSFLQARNVLKVSGNTFLLLFFFIHVERRGKQSLISGGLVQRNDQSLWWVHLNRRKTDI